MSMDVRPLLPPGPLPPAPKPGSRRKLKTVPIGLVPGKFKVIDVEDSGRVIPILPDPSSPPAPRKPPARRSRGKFRLVKSDPTQRKSKSSCDIQKCVR